MSGPCRLCAQRQARTCRSRDSADDPETQVAETCETEQYEEFVTRKLPNRSRVDPRAAGAASA